MVKNDIYGFLQSSAVDQEFKDEVKKLLFDSIAVQVKRWALSTDKYAVSGRDLTLAAGMWLMK